MLQHCSKQPEANTEIFSLTEESLRMLDNANEAFTANLSLYYSVKLAARLGFEIQGHYTAETPVLDYQEGIFTEEIPAHKFYMPASLSQPLSDLILSPLEDIGNVNLNRAMRNAILEHLQIFFRLHIPYYGKLNSPEILKQILG